MAFMRTRLALMKAAHVAKRTAHVVGQVHGVARPLYNAARPLLHHHGIDTSIADRALSTYDGIRRAIGH
jgi:hypothetical protein